MLLCLVMAEAEKDKSNNETDVYHQINLQLISAEIFWNRNLKDK